MPCCFYCNNRVFPTARAFARHLKNPRFSHPQCQFCKQVFSSEDLLSSHIHEKHPFRCSICERSYQTSASLVEHYRGSCNHPNCPSCGRGFFDEAACLEHQLLAHPLPEYDCPRCERKFFSEVESLTHQLSEHLKKMCPLCGGEEIYVDSFDQHYLFSPNHPSCKACNLGFEDDAEYRKHIVENHAQCETCGEHFETKEEVASHSSSHPRCDDCQEVFVDADAYGDHIGLVHTPDDSSSVDSNWCHPPSSPEPDIDNDNVSTFSFDLRSAEHGGKATHREVNYFQQVYDVPPRPVNPLSRSELELNSVHMVDILVDEHDANPRFHTSRSEPRTPPRFSSRLSPAPIRSVASSSPIPTIWSCGSSHRSSPASPAPQARNLLGTGYPCRICNGLPLNPVTTPCGHVFCQECLHLALWREQRCPWCRRKISGYIRIEVDNN